MISVADRFAREPIEVKPIGEVDLEAEAARLEAQKLADAQALATWTAYRDAQMVTAKARASELTTATALLITSCTTMSLSKANWIRTEVANSKKRLNESIARLAETVDPDERQRIEAEIESEKNTIDGWVVARPVDAKVVEAVKLRDRRAAGIKESADQVTEAVL